MNESKTLVIGNSDLSKDFYSFLSAKNLPVCWCNSIEEISESNNYRIIAVFDDEILIESLHHLRKIGFNLSESIIVVNLYGKFLTEVQSEIGHEVIGLNFTYPIFSSPFMEIIKNGNTNNLHIDELLKISQENWGMDPYTCENISIRTYLLAAMTREGLNLVTNGYADVESIDRACRNDAGYYLPFTGNFMYMDLMGTLAYALVMKELNPELSNDDKLPSWFLQKQLRKEMGMRCQKGFYDYNENDFENWQNLVDDFSVDIRKIIDKYKKDYQENNL